ncbi:MAG: PEP-CTERM sorting domain-containing protein, partial [Pontiella sp.]|nr:PEP-CTERM sorting domain-containing protein [Pontiella sp.]
FYAINSFQGISRQRLYLDDAVLRVVPEPSTVQLSLLGGYSTWLLRRKKCRRPADDKCSRC